eukprot:1161669-Pelagomonas_calceolata.AAC.12
MGTMQACSQHKAHADNMCKDKRDTFLATSGSSQGSTQDPSHLYAHAQTRMPGEVRNSSPVLYAPRLACQAALKTQEEANDMP